MPRVKKRVVTKKIPKGQEAEGSPQEEAQPQHDGSREEEVDQGSLSRHG